VEGGAVANKGWVDQVSTTVQWLKSAGLSGTANAALENTNDALKHAQESEFTRSSMERLSTAWASLMGNPSVKGTLEKTGSAYSNVHDKVVRDDRYAAVVEGTGTVLGAVGSVIGDAFNKIAATDAYKKTAEKVTPYASAAAEKVGPYATAAKNAVTPAVNATVGHFKPVKAAGDTPPAEGDTSEAPK
jgi:hypothetical protein